MLEKAATMKRFEYSLLGKELKAKTDITKKQYQKLDDTFEFHKIIKKEKLILENYSKSDLTYNSKYNFYNYYCNSKKINNLSLKSKYLILVEYFNDLNEFNKLKTQKEKRQVYMMQLQNYIIIS